MGADTATVSKASLKPGRRRWEEAFSYIASQPGLSDVVVSGGDAYYLTPDQLVLIGERLVALPNIQRFRFASKGLAVAPGRVLDEADAWVDALVAVSDKARRAGKAVAWHTHFNHPAEISWVTERASQRLFERGVMVRNQTVLLRGVNDDVETMGTLIRKLADNNIFPVSFFVSLSLFLVRRCCLASTRGCIMLTPSSTMSISAIWSKASSICARRCRRYSTSRQDFVARSPAS